MSVKAGGTPNFTTVEQGAPLRQQAYAQPPIKVEQLAVDMIAIVLTFSIFPTILIVLKIYIRGCMERITKALGWEDAFAVWVFT